MTTASREEETTSGDLIRVMEEEEDSRQEEVMEREEDAEEVTMIEDEAMEEEEDSTIEIDSPAVLKDMVNRTERTVGEAREATVVGMRTEAPPPSLVQACHPRAPVLT